MNNQLLSAVTKELRHHLEGRFLGKVFQLGPLPFAADFGLKGRFLLVSAEPASPRLYLIERKLKEVEKQSTQLTFFGQAIRSKIGGAKLIDINKDYRDRVVRFSFCLEDELGQIHFRRLIVQVTGRSANIFLTDELSRIQFALRAPRGSGQQIDDTYSAPLLGDRKTEQATPLLEGSPSAIADEYFTRLEDENDFDARAKSIRSKLQQTASQKQKLKQNLLSDLTKHGDAETHKRIGDLLLANLTTATRSDGRVQLTDYFADGEPTIEVEVDPNDTLQEEAARRFREYSKAKRAVEEISKRVSILDQELAQLNQRSQELERIMNERDETALSQFDGKESKQQSDRTEKTKPLNIPGVKRYLSTDGYEILVGRAARDNDNLTFKIAKPHDLWLHAGDYPGSHVVVRNSTKKEIPQRTVIEAAQLAARFSQASEDSHVVVHYTQRKFLSKPKGSAPGLVRLSSFRSITVEPKESVKRL